MGKHSKEDKKDHKHHKKDSHKHSHHSRHSHRNRSSSISSSSDSDNESDNGVQKITEDDYFLKIDEYRVWLALVKKTSLENISSSEARKVFREDFVYMYNRGKLPTMYYKGIPSEIKNEYTKVHRSWVKKLSTSERENLAATADEVDIITKNAKEGSWRHMKSAESETNKPLPSKENHTEKSQTVSDRYEKERDIMRQHKRNISELIDDMDDKNVRNGRERMSDRRADRNFRLHSSSDSSRRERDVHDDYSYDTKDDFQREKARLQAARDQERKKSNDLINSSIQKEDAVVEGFRKQLAAHSSGGGRAMVPDRE